MDYLRNLAYIILFLILSISTVSCQHPDNSSKLCLTRGCIHAAGDIINSIDETVDPCDDFYQFACGRYIDEVIIPDDKHAVDMFSLITDKVKQQLRALLENPVENNDSRSVILAKKFYQACNNAGRIEELGHSVIKDLLKKVGGWPVLDGDSWEGNNFTWTSLMQTFKELGLPSGYFVQFTVATDMTNSSIRAIELDQTHDFGLARDFLIQGKFVDIYQKFMVEVAVQLGANRERAEKELKESLDFEIALAKYTLSQENRRNYSLLHNPQKIWKLQEKYPEISWLNYFNHILPREAQLTENDTVVVVVPVYLKSVTELISKTPARVQANYAVWRAVQDTIEYGPLDIYQHFAAASFAISGQLAETKRWQACVDKVSYELAPAVASMYVRKYFDEEAKLQVTELTRYMRKSFEFLLENLDWMDEETRQKALNKAKKIEEHIAYPSELLDDKILDEYFNKLEVYEDRYLESQLNINVHSYDFVYKRLFELVNKTDWRDHADAFSTGAWYSGSENSIRASAGILQGTFFNKDRPMYLNFGGIGFVMGHEITHGFDDKGSQLDENGNLKTWWDSNTNENFLSKTQCLIDQYESYTVTELNENINGILTLSENIADNVAVKEAYLAYNKWTQVNGVEQKLPALNYTPNQLFWISAAKNWCAKTRKQYSEILVKTDNHAPGRFRVLGPLQNSEEFSIDFSCQVGSNMNPPDKCSVW